MTHNRISKTFFNLLLLSFLISMVMHPVPAVTASAKTAETGAMADDQMPSLPEGISSEDWSQIEALLPAAVASQQAYLKASNNPVLIWNTFLVTGNYSSGDGSAIATDGNGAIFVTGQSSGTWGVPIQNYSGNGDAFVAKIDASGILQWNTFIGGSEYDSGNSIVTDVNGNIYILGSSNSTWGSPILTYKGNSDIYIAKLNSDGVLQWNTFLGSSGGVDKGSDVVLDENGNIYVTGYSTATWGSPIRAYFGSGQDGFAAKLNPNGT
ncbi:MAG: SBBP repeat-containing protein [Anaerolineales bacterium]|nr:MAG: SBBP repeat-containing protein [Anaerolineales bacterium]